MRYILEYLLTLSPLILIVRLLWNRPQKQYTTMRCPTCGDVAQVFGDTWECTWCGDCGKIYKR